MTKPETKCINCKEFKICVRIEMSVPVQAPFKYEEQVHICLGCLRSDGDRLAPYFASLLSRKTLPVVENNDHLVYVPNPVYEPRTAGRRG